MINPEYLIDTETIYDSMMLDKVNSHIDGPYYIYGPNDDLFTEFELGKRMAEDGVDYNMLTVSTLFTKEMDRGYEAGWDTTK